MEVCINNQPVVLEEKVSLFQLLFANGLSDKKGIAVAVNNKVISRSSWNSCLLNPNDSVTIIKATQGG